MTQVFITGQGGTVTVGATDLQVQKWSGKITTEKLDVTNTASQGWRQLLAGGIKEFKGDFECDWQDAIQGSSTYPFPFTGGTTFSTCTFKVGDSSHTLSGLFQIDLDITSDVKGKGSYKGSFESAGAVNYA